MKKLEVFNFEWYIKGIGIPFINRNKIKGLRNCVIFFNKLKVKYGSNFSCMVFDYKDKYKFTFSDLEKLSKKGLVVEK